MFLTQIDMLLGFVHQNLMFNYLHVFVVIYLFVQIPVHNVIFDGAKGRFTLDYGIELENFLNGLLLLDEIRDTSKLPSLSSLFRTILLISLFQSTLLTPKRDTSFPGHISTNFVKITVFSTNLESISGG